MKKLILIQLHLEIYNHARTTQDLAQLRTQIQTQIHRKQIIKN